MGKERIGELRLTHSPTWSFVGVMQLKYEWEMGSVKEEEEQSAATRTADSSGYGLRSERENLFYHWFQRVYS